MLTLCLVVVVGYVAERCGFFSEDFTNRLSRLIVQITCPALILSSVMGGELPDRHLIMPLLGVSIASYIVITVVAIALARLCAANGDSHTRNSIAFMTIFGNVGFIGYPVCHALYGPQAVFYASILNFPNTLWVFTIGTMLISGEKIHDASALFKALLRPGCIASYISIIIVVFGIQNLPGWLCNATRLVGDITVPGSLIVIGSSMAKMSIRKMLGDPLAYASATLRLLIAPVVVYLLCLVIPCTPFIRNINMLVFAMPVASFGTMLCYTYKRDPSLMTATTFITTVISLVSIPLLQYFLT